MSEVKPAPLGDDSAFGLQPISEVLPFALLYGINSILDGDRMGILRLPALFHRLR